MSKLTSVGFIPPPDFPAEAHNNVHQRLNEYKDTQRKQLRLFRLGWNGLAYRYRAMAEYDDEFTASVKKFGNSPPFEERYKQGKALFGFFINAVSVIDCFFFSTYCMASILKPDDFPISQSKDLVFYKNPVMVKFNEHFPKEHLSKNMKRCLGADSYRQLNNIRKVLIHRGTPPRSFDVGGEHNGIATMPINPEAPSNQWQFDFPVDEHTTKMFREWLSDTLKDLIDSAADFCKRQLRP